MAEIAVKLAISKGEQLVGSIVDKVHAGISRELSLLLGVRQEIKYIIDELEIMSAFLREAEKKQASNEAAKAWMKQMKQLAYIVEDYIDDFSLHLQRRGNYQNVVVTTFQRLVLCLRTIKPRHRIATQIQSIKSTVEEVSNRGMRYRIMDVSQASSGDDYNVAQHDPRLAALFVEDSQLVGIEAPRKKLQQWLLDETEHELTLIAVVGEGGLGKTTIVKKAYESLNVTDGRFKCRAWVTVSQVYNLEEMMINTISQVFPPMNDQERRDLLTLGKEQLISKLRNYLEDKKYVIVFDDMWNIDAWNSLENALPNNNHGSRVLLTTRNKELADVAACCPQIHGHVYHHKKLSPEDSFDLFSKRVFNSSCPLDMEELTREILKKCDGLPLAIVSIAGVLASKPRKTSEEWKNMLARLGSELEYNPNLGGMKQILTLSYNDLPYYVKHCFLYLSKYPEDYLIRRKLIQNLWIAEGFVAGRHDMTAEEVAESYFNELVNRFMILPSDFSLNGKVKSFRIHDIMLELIVSKAREENFKCLPGKNSSWIPQDVIRRLSVYTEHNLENISLSHVRSLSMFGDGAPTLLSTSLEHLRVLDLEGYRGLENEDLRIVMKLLHLKYLNLRNIWVSKLPKSLGNLRKLEILDIKGTDIEVTPAGVIKGGRSLCFGAEGFPSLKVLRLLYLGLHSLKFQEGAPCPLEVLVMRERRQISISGIKNLPSLKEIRYDFYEDTDEHTDDGMDALTAQVNEHPNHPRLIKSL